MNGLLPHVKMTCIGWETTTLQTVIEHCKHAERQQLSQDKTKQRMEKVECTAGILKDRASRLKDDLQKYWKRGKGRGRRGGGDGADGPDDSNHNAILVGKSGHFAKDC